MIQTSVSQDGAIHRSSGSVGLLYRSEQSGDELWTTLDIIRENVRTNGGQFFSFNLANPMEESPLATFYDALKKERWEQSVHVRLLSNRRHNPQIASVFINRAILWQRLCDLLIAEDESLRETVLVLENIDHASPSAQQEIARLIRFHEKHVLNRVFVMTIEDRAHVGLIPELRDVIEQRTTSVAA